MEADEALRHTKDAPRQVVQSAKEARGTARAILLTFPKNISVDINPIKSVL